jgi:hypothetical protein
MSKNINSAKAQELRLTMLQHGIQFQKNHRELRVSRKEGSKDRATLIRFHHGNENLNEWFHANFEELNLKLDQVSNGSMSLSGTQKTLFGWSLDVCILHEDDPKSVDGFDWLLSLFEKN